MKRDRLRGLAVVLTLGWASVASATMAEPLCVDGSSVIRADLRTGEVRAAAESETLTYSTDWDGGDTVIVAANGTPLSDALSGSGTVVWMPRTAGTYELTHTVVTGGVKVVLRATFRVGETLCESGSGAVRADLRTGEVRATDSTETLTYSTEWDDGDVVTIKVNGVQVFQGSGTGVYSWIPTAAGTYELAHTAIVYDDPFAFETAWFRVYGGSPKFPWKIGATEGDSVVAWTNGTGTLVVSGSGKMKSFGSDGTGLPWPSADVSAVVIEPTVTQIGTNAWYGLGENVPYTVYSPAAKTLSDGFGGSLGYARTKFKAFQSANGVVTLAVALETAPSLTNDWTAVSLEKGDVSVNDEGNIVIEHDTDDQQQGFYIIQTNE